MNKHNNPPADFYHQSVIYEVNLRQYTPEGTIQAFMQHLPRLKDMGVKILWFMPIHPIGIHNRKGTLGSYYSIRDFKEVNPEFGNKEDFAQLVEEIHRLDMKIIIDWVANHAAWDNVWTLTHPEYFEHHSDGSLLSPYDWTDVIQINHQNEAAHEAMREAMCYWVEHFDIDGFRADLAHLTPLHFWVKAKIQTTALKPGLIWLAETEDAAFYEVFDIVYAWKWMHKTEEFCKRHFSMQELFHLLMSQKNSYPTGALELFFTSNHDENSWNGSEFEKYGPLSKAFAAFSFLYNHSVPLIYSGQEIPNQKRLSFFDKDALNWASGSAEHEFYSKLIKLRNRFSANDTFEWLLTGDHNMGFVRFNEDVRVIYLLNAGNESYNFNLSEQNDLANYIDLFTGNRYESGSGRGIEIDSKGFCILEFIG